MTDLVEPQAVDVDRAIAWITMTRPGFDNAKAMAAANKKQAGE